MVNYEKHFSGEIVHHEISHAPDIASPEVQRKLIREQDPKILDAAETIAARVSHIPPDIAHPEVAPRALIVGGFLRDAFWGLHPKDADLEVYGVEPARLTEFLKQHYPTQMKTTGRAFPIHKINLGNGVELDVSIPRRESQPGVRSSDIVIEGDPTLTIEEAASRRDFTFNSLAFDPLTHELYDPFGGVQDIKDHIMRVTNPEKFTEDPVRIYRAIQFVGRLNPNVESQTFAFLQHMVERGDMEHVDANRVTTEMDKLLTKSERPSLGFEFAKDLGIVERYMPELFALRGCEQEPEWHPEGDVWVHTMMVIDAAAKIVREAQGAFSKEEVLQIMLGALCHDFGKPATTKHENGRIRSLNHEEAGREPTKAFLSRYAFGSTVNFAVETIAAEHLKPGVLYTDFTKGRITEKQYANIVRRLLSRIRPVSYRVLVASAEADSRGRTLPGVATDPYDPGEKFYELVTHFDLEKQAAAPLVGGRDILAITKQLDKNIQAGPVFSEMIAQVESLRDSGEISTREEALARLEKIIREK